MRDDFIDNLTALLKENELLATEIIPEFSIREVGRHWCEGSDVVKVTMASKFELIVRGINKNMDSEETAKQFEEMINDRKW